MGPFRAPVYGTDVNFQGETQAAIRAEADSSSQCGSEPLYY